MSLTFDDVRDWIKKESNFFRVHLLFFLLVPLISAAIFYGANGEFHIPFIDALFLCYSALTVTGLSTVNLSTCTVFQQVILYVLQGVGDVSIVAWVMVLIRKRYFVQHLESIKRRENVRNVIFNRVSQRASLAPDARKGGSAEGSHENEKIEIHVNQPSAQNTLVERRPPSHFDPEEGIGAALVGGGSAGIGLSIALSQCIPNNNGIGPIGGGLPNPSLLASAESARLGVDSASSLTDSYHFAHRESEEDHTGIVADAHSFTSSPRSGLSPLPVSQTANGAESQPFSAMFATATHLRSRRGVPMPRRQTVIQPPKMDSGIHALGRRGKDQGLGGFPGPIQLTRKLARKYFPRVHRLLEHIITQPLAAHGHGRGKSFKWLSDEFSKMVILRNSDFDTEELDDEELERLGGLEYRALHFLSYLVIGYFVGSQLISIILIAPWLATTHTYDDVFAGQPRLVNKSWFVAFQIMASYTGGGMSLVDTGMVPFQQAYLMIFSMIFTILAGNHGLPIFLRFIIWICTKIVKDGSAPDRTLHFLLDHPRRCFIYLFPSHVTWFLFATLVFFTSIEWISFIVLDIGLAVTDSLPGGTRAVAGLFQSFAVRASGFAIVNLSALAPAFQFLCVIMMYIAIYPVAMSIRSTNVYEEKSLGIFELPAVDENEEPNLGEDISRRERIWRYFGWHLRKQVAYDIWWLVSAIFLIGIIERTKIMDDENAPWFNLFRILFELVSAFGGIGLTLGIPTENFSFSGAFGPLSKLIVIIVMVRGRHRGLPVAIDRAILLPEDLVPAKREGANDTPLAVAADTNIVPNSGFPVDGMEKERRSRSLQVPPV